ncbi:hypothetical protein SELMODRAFT_404617 [Selaginella moellendorffii]|uniref:CHCH domain-containing protein n=1 Tax=Selaginella moellendorffii TaxID=88036 RepID=D8QVW3_SELML|nr:hypothetical protein SELMODRAFT_404617 [Selaginella moellendorffii]
MELGKAPPRPKVVQRPNSAPPPSVYHALAPSMLGGLAATIVQGAAFGTSSAMAHCVVDAIVGPCIPALVAFKHKSSMLLCRAIAGWADATVCVNSNLNDIGKCQFLLDLNECHKTSSGPSQP